MIQNAELLVRQPAALLRERPLGRGRPGPSMEHHRVEQVVEAGVGVVPAVVAMRGALHDVATGAEELLHHAEHRLGIKAGNTTPDGLFTIEDVECVAACTEAPCLTVNYRYFYKVDPEDFDVIVEDLRNGRRPTRKAAETGADIFVEPEQAIPGSTPAATRLLLLAQNRQGYLNLCELLARGWVQNAQRAQAWITWAFRWTTRPNCQN